MKKLVALIILISSSEHCVSQSAPSQGWVDSLYTDLMSKGISDSTWIAIKPLLVFDNRVNSLDKAQPEFTQNLTSYLSSRITDSRIEYAKQMLKRHESLLDSIELEFNVPRELIVSLWGLESDFGRFQGNFNIITSLTSLATGRRGTYFRNELLEAIVFFEDENYTPDNFLGSWAGAIGQCQFMPWNARKYGIDYDRDGIVDLKNSTTDALASIGNFVKSLGWNNRFIWGRRVLLSETIESSLLDGKTRHLLSMWEKLGVRRLNGDSLPVVDIKAALLKPKRSGGRIYLIYSNFDVIMKWNRSHYFALTVGTLADKLKYK